jgi:subfamily B ATP-binding cassette protein MsbA
VTNIVSREGLRLVAALRRRVHDHVGRLPVTYFDSTKAGVLSSRIIADVEGGRHLMGNMLVEFIGSLSPRCSRADLFAWDQRAA